MAHWPRASWERWFPQLTEPFEAHLPLEITMAYISYLKGPQLPGMGCPSPPRVLRPGWWWGVGRRGPPEMQSQPRWGEAGGVRTWGSGPRCSPCGVALWHSDPCSTSRGADALVLPALEPQRERAWSRAAGSLWAHPQERLLQGPALTGIPLLILSLKGC